MVAGVRRTYLELIFFFFLAKRCFIAGWERERAERERERERESGIKI
jgi:hypothetical protein